MMMEMYRTPDPVQYGPLLVVTDNVTVSYLLYLPFDDFLP